MTLFFIDKAKFQTLSERLVAERGESMLSMLSEVVAIVGNDDKWIAVKDRHGPPGLEIGDQRKGYLLSHSHTVIRTDSH